MTAVRAVCWRSSTGNTCCMDSPPRRRRETALGEEIRGEGIVGLARAFFYAGAPRVVVSLWRVDDRSTSSLMEEFYRQHLLHGLAPAAALRQAQIRMWQGKRDLFHWAAFALQGEWRPAASVE